MAKQRERTQGGPEATPDTELTDAELTSLLRNRESRLLDFKETPPDLESRKGKAELAKDVLCFANSLALGEIARIVYGVRDPDRGGGLAGVHRMPNAETVGQVIADYTAPPPRTSFREYRLDGRDVGVLTIIGVLAKPHHAARQYEQILNPHVFYVRRDKVNATATSREVEDMLLERIRGPGYGVDQVPLKVGFVSLGQDSRARELVVRVTNTAETSIAGIEVLVDFEQMGLPELAARRGLLTNMVLGPGESREATVPLAEVRFVFRSVDPTSPPTIRAVMASPFTGHYGCGWLNATLRVAYRDAEGLVQEITKTMALDA